MAYPIVMGAEALAHLDFFTDDVAAAGALVRARPVRLSRVRARVENRSGTAAHGCYDPPPNTVGR
ncbi:hypothetical protein AB0H12_04160 [Actinosynnema sp. NPDC023794]